MFGWVLKKMGSQANRLDDSLIDRFDFVADVPGTLVIRPKLAWLDRSELEEVCQRLLEAKDLHLVRIQFDFSAVTELAGSWSVHFGLLIWLSRKVAQRVSVIGLRGQPASAAWTYRSSPAMRLLLGEARTESSTHVAAVSRN